MSSLESPAAASQPIEAPDLLAPEPSRFLLWFRSRFTRAGYEKRAADKLARQVRLALVSPGSAAGKAVTKVALDMAHGIVARWLDDRGHLRCAYCIETGQLTFKGKTREGKKVYACQTHGGKR